MHTCQVAMRYDDETPDDHLIECGAEANKMIGFVWVCDYHWEIFGVSTFGEEFYAGARRVTDSRGIK